MYQPTISFIIPTYNASSHLEQCILAILNQNYPKEKMEIIIADGGSTDNTREIVKKYPSIMLIDNPQKISEYGREEAFRLSKNELIAFLDFDNILVTNEWINEIIKPFAENEEIIGVESNYLIADNFTSLNTYANLLVIVDPVARMIASPYTEESAGNYIIKTFEKGSSPIGGANGFIWKRSVIEKYNPNSDVLNESGLLLKIAQNQDVKVANIPGVGIYHYYTATIGDYIKKRLKIGTKHSNRVSKGQRTWVENQGKSKLILTTLYFLTIIGPTIEAIAGVIRTKRIEWLYHPFIGFLSTCIYIFIFTKKLIK